VDVIKHILDRIQKTGAHLEKSPNVKLSFINSWDVNDLKFPCFFVYNILGVPILIRGMCGINMEC
jgi:hypothetical protein